MARLDDFLQELLADSKIESYIECEPLPQEWSGERFRRIVCVEDVIGKSQTTRDAIEALDEKETERLYELAAIKEEERRNEY